MKKIFLFLIFIYVCCQLHTTSKIMPDRHRGYYRIALGFAQINDFENALNYVEKIQDSGKKEDCYSMIIKEMIDANLDDLAIKTSEKLSTKHLIRNFHKIIVKRYIERSEYENAISFNHDYDFQSFKEQRINLIIRDMIEKNKVADLINFYNEYVERFNEENHFNEVARNFVKFNNKEGLNEFINQTKTFLNEKKNYTIISFSIQYDNTHLFQDLFDSLNTQKKDQANARIAKDLIMQRKYPEAYRIMEKIQPGKYLDSVYLEFVSKYTDGNNISGNNVKKALTFTNKMFLPKNKDKALKKCVRFYVTQGFAEKAIPLIQELSNELAKDKATADIVLGLFKNDEIKKCNELIQNVSNINHINKLHNDIVEVLARSNNFAEAEKYLIKFTMDHYRDNALSALSNQCIKLEEFDNAERYAEMMHREESKMKMMENISNSKNGNISIGK